MTFSEAPRLQIRNGHLQPSDQHLARKSSAMALGHSRFHPLLGRSRVRDENQDQVEDTCEQ
jgi:hypothetical protein